MLKQTLVIPRIILIILGIIFLNSCIDNSRTIIRDRSVILKEARITPKSFVLFLPDTSGITFGGYNVDLKDSLYIRSLSYPKPTIEVYKLNSGELITSFLIDKAVDLGGVYYDAESGGYFVFENFDRKLLFVDNSGNILNQWDEFKQINVRGVGNFYSNWGFFQMVKTKDKLYFPIDISHGNHVDHENKDFINMPNLRVFSLDTQSFTSIGKVSPSNAVNDYGLSQRYTFAFDNHYFVLSPAYHSNLIKISLNSQHIEFKDDASVSSFLEIKPFRTWDEKVTNPFKSGFEETSAMMEFYRTSPLFSGIYFDPYRDLYYRSFIIPRTNERNGEAGVIVYDKDLNFQAIYSIPNHYNLNGAFVTEEGFNLLNRQEYQLDNNKLIYDAFVFD